LYTSGLVVTVVSLDLVVGPGSFFFEHEVANIIITENETIADR